jgi:hypothetical protein
MRSRMTCWAGAAALSVLVSVAAWAADAGGKWTWMQRGQGGNETKMLLELKQDGEKLTGTLTREGADQKTEIKEGTIKNNEVSFVVVRQFNGNEFKISYKGKLEGDTITGKSSFGRDGETRERDWKATRAK